MDEIQDLLRAAAPRTAARACCAVAAGPTALLTAHVARTVVAGRTEFEAPPRR
jgi:NADPH-dependent 2,4-dienoyl-CoA reductase/sulfur reductase-like enzyme